jgi:uncharacterized repeat protein (TIGR03803 family)
LQAACYSVKAFASDQVHRGMLPSSQYAHCVNHIHMFWPNFCGLLWLCAKSVRGAWTMYFEAWQRSRSLRGLLSLLGVAVACMAVPLSGSAATKPATLYSFCAVVGCADGSGPTADLVMDATGHFYGTTVAGGSYSSGAVFEIWRDATTGKWVRRVLHSFCVKGWPCVDGATPAGKLVLDVNGNLHGTAITGNGNGGGVIFEMHPLSNGSWSYGLLLNFCQKANCVDGKAPSSGLTYQGAATGAPYDGVSPLYGTTLAGGTHGQGVAFQLTPTTGGKWSATTLYNFCGLSGCMDGAQPWQGLTMDWRGDIFGVTYGRGDRPGLVFELHRGQTSWQEIVLHRFCRIANCADGRAPNALVMDATGNLFGTAYGGGANGQGLIFQITPNGVSSAYSVLYNFCSQNYCYDGASPSSSLILDASGNLFGTTYYGGMGQLDRDEIGGGTVFRITPNKTYSVVQNFCSMSNCSDGEYPAAGVVMDATGSVYGTTQLGGSHGSMFLGGTVYRVSF